jgi:hypothetical protein
MRNIFDLTKREQRIVILIVAALVAFAFAKHFWQNRSRSAPTGSTSIPTPSPLIHAEEEQLEPDDSR